MRSVPAGLLLMFFTLPAMAGIFTWVQVVKDGETGVDGLDEASAVAISPTGEHVYTSSRGDSAVVTFGRDATADTLAFFDIHKQDVNGVFGLTGASDVVVSPESSHVYAAGSDDDSVVVFRRNPADGSLQFANVIQDSVGGVFGIAGASSVTVSGDSRHLLVTGRMGDSLAMFTRSATNDSLELVDVEFDGVTADGLRGAADAAVSPDGESVYVAGRLANALVTFTRDASADSLAFRQVLYDDENGVDGLGEISSVTVTPDGEQVIATGYEDDAVTVFDRDPKTGDLTFHSSYRDGVDGVEGLDGANAVVTNPQGNLVFVAGSNDASVAVFNRDWRDGGLIFLEVVRNGIGVNGLTGVAALAVSPETRHIYATSLDDDAIVSFQLRETLFEDDFESGDCRAWGSRDSRTCS